MRALVVCKKRSGGDQSNGVRVIHALVRSGVRSSWIDHESLIKAPGPVADFDLILFFNCAFKYPASVSVAKAHARPGAKVALWNFDLLSGQSGQSSRYRKVVNGLRKHLDLFASVDGTCGCPYSENENYLWLPQGVDSQEFRPNPMPQTDREFDVIFTGSNSPRHSGRDELISALVADGRSVLIHGTARFPGAVTRPPVFGHDLFMAYQKARVALVPGISGVHHCWSNRIYLATASGACCVVGHTPGLEEEFRHPWEIVEYRSLEQLVDSVRVLCRDDESRRVIAASGRNRTLNCFTYEHRVLQLLGALGFHRLEEVA